MSISNHGEERNLTDTEWALVAHTVAERLGLTEHDARAGVRWFAVHHGPGSGDRDHIHLQTTLVREDGRAVYLSNNRRALREVAADMRRLVRACITAAHTESEFVVLAAQPRIAVRPRCATGFGRTAVVGYSVARPSSPGSGEDLVWFGGGKLGRDLTLPALRAGSSQDPDPDAAAAWRALTTHGASASSWTEPTDAPGRLTRGDQGAQPARPGYGVSDDPGSGVSPANQTCLVPRRCGSIEEKTAGGRGRRTPPSRVKEASCVVGGLGPGCRWCSG